MIEQATKILNAVHKRMHTAQQKEFSLLKELFRRDPQALWRSNKNPNFNGDVQQLQEALDNRDIVPKADPNTASQALRIQKAQAIYNLAMTNPMMFDMKVVFQRYLTMLDIDDADALFNKQPPQPQVDQAAMMTAQAQQTAAQAQMLSAQAKMSESQIKAQSAEKEIQIKVAQLGAQNMEAETKRQVAQTDAQNHAEDRKGKLQLEAMKLQQSQLVHQDKISQDQSKNNLELLRDNMKAQRDQQTKGLDLAHARQMAMEERRSSHVLAERERRHALDVAQAEMAHKAQQEALKRMHELDMAHNQASLNERAQMLKPEVGGE